MPVMMIMVNWEYAASLSICEENAYVSLISVLLTSVGVSRILINHVSSFPGRFEVSWGLALIIISTSPLPNLSPPLETSYFPADENMLASKPL